MLGQGYRLLNECQTQFDSAVALGASEYAFTENGHPLEDLVHSYKLRETEPAHKIGTVFDSQRQDWDLSRPALDIPELIREADVVIVANGGGLSLNRANWARIAKKPILPVARFGGAAREVYDEELRTFGRKYGGHLSRDEFQQLNRHNVDMPSLAKSVVHLAKKVCTPNLAFVVMSFSPRDDLVDLYETFQRVCEERDFRCERVDENNEVVRIVPAIWEKIRRGAFVIVDLSIPSQNVYYELGYAEALGKTLVVTAKKGTKLPFDINDLPVIEWTNQKDLRKKLSDRIGWISDQLGGS